MDYKTALDSAAQQEALQVLHQRYTFSRDNALRVWERARSMVIVDCDIVVDDMEFIPREEPGAMPVYQVRVDDIMRTWSIHPHALRQMAAEVNIPGTFVSALTSAIGAWERRELTDLLNERFKKSEFKQRSFRQRASFVNRVVGDEVRGFVSPSFKLWLSTPHMLVAFAQECSTYGAMPVEATGSDLSFSFHSVLPHVFEPKSREFVALGCSFSNSDFGAGALRVQLNVLNLKTGGVAALKTILSKSHGGAARKDQEERSATISAETVENLVKGAQGEVRDAVKAALHPDSVSALLEMITKAMSVEIPWHRLQSYLAGKLTQEEIAHIEALIEGKKKSTTLPPLRILDGAPEISMWWAASAVAEIASAITDDDRRSDLVDLAGSLINK